MIGESVTMSNGQIGKIGRVVEHGEKSVLVQVGRGEVKLLQIGLIPLDGAHRLALDPRVLQEQRLDLLAPAQQCLERVAFEARAKVQCDAFQVNAAACYRLDMLVVDKCDSVQVYYLK